MGEPASITVSEMTNPTIAQTSGQPSSGDLQMALVYRFPWGAYSSSLRLYIAANHYHCPNRCNHQISQNTPAKPNNHEPTKGWSRVMAGEACFYCRYTHLLRCILGNVNPKTSAEFLVLYRSSFPHLSKRVRETNLVRDTC